MTLNYDSLVALAGRMGYQKFTPLQEKAFRSAEACDPDRNLLVVGPTSSGKTLVPVLLYCDMVTRALASGDPIPKMLFIVPYRALAAQKCRELEQELARAVGKEQYITVRQSTGEYRRFDRQICDGQTDVAVVINEKAFLFAKNGEAFLSQFDLVVLDEIGLLADQSRGIKLDFILAWCSELQRRGRGPRMIALGTPFYDWSAYAQQFDFVQIASQGRPRLLECPVYVSGGSDLRRVDVDGWPEECAGYTGYRLYREDKYQEIICAECGQQCPAEHPSRHDPSLLCSQTGRTCSSPVRRRAPGENYRFKIVADLCRWHLQKNHQILVFWNNREEVRNLAVYLYQELTDLLPPPPPLEECKERILQACTEIANRESDLHRSEQISEDELFGILVDEHYQALCSGIGFHSSAVPLELRSYVEQEFLAGGSLRLVCCTETLAFGINSATDCVIVADLKKTVLGEPQYLSANEYQNYIGRCGRLRITENAEDIVGYVHPILMTHSPSDPYFTPDNPEYRGWLQLKHRCENPVRIHSSLFGKSEGDSYLPFLLLCLIPGWESGRYKSKTVLAEWMEQLPRPENADPGDLDRALDFLLQHGLIEDVRRRLTLPPALRRTPQYCLASERETLCGFTPSAEDFDTLLSAMQQALSPDGILREAFLIYHLLAANCMKSQMANFNIRDPRRVPPQTGANTIADPDEQRSAEEERFLQRFQPERLPQLLGQLPVWQQLQPLLNGTVQLKKLEDRKRLVVTAAVLCWAESANPRQIFEWFRTGYPLIQALTRELGYLLEICAECTYLVPRLPKESEEHYIKRRAEISAQIHALERAVYFGLQPQLYSKLVSFFKNEPGDAARSIYRIIANPYPGTARQLRRIFTSYTILIDALENQKRGRGAYNYQLARSALRELRSLERRKDEHGLWPKFAMLLRNEVAETNE